jgi:hypothetical protein
MMILFILVAGIALSIMVGSFGFALAGFVMERRVGNVERIRRDVAIAKALRG